MLTFVKIRFSAGLEAAGGAAPASPSVKTVQAPATQAASNMVTLPLTRLIKGLPDSLKSFISKPPPADATVSFPVTRIMPQLAKGAIKVTFGELAAASPPGIFQVPASQSEVAVPLPLKEVLPLLSSLMKRKAPTKDTGTPAQRFFAPTGTASPTGAPDPHQAPKPTPPAAAQRTAPAPPAESPAGTASFALAKLLAGLPENCQKLVTQSPGADVMVHLPVERLAPQLARGRISITVGELVKVAPPGFMDDPGPMAAKELRIPLADLLAQIGPGSLKRKTPVKTLQGVPAQDFFGAGQTAAAPAPPTPPPPAATPPPTATSAPQFAPAPPGATTFAPKGPAAPATFQPAAPQPTSPAPAAPPAAGSIAPEGQAVFVLERILASLPAELKSVVAKPPAGDVRVHFPVELLAPQLAKGRVSVTLKQLAEAAPVGTFANVSGKENQAIILPLGDVLGQIGSGALKRREPVKRLEGLENQDFFGGTASAVAPPPEAPPEGQGTGFTAFTPKPGPPEPAGSGYTTFQPAPVASPTPSPQAAASFAPAETAPPLPGARPADDTGGTSVDRVAIPVTKLAERWSDQMKSELARLPNNTVIEFPAEELGHALKTGKVLFTWSQLRNWSKPRTTLAFPAHEDTTLDIPLRAVVGPFMAAMRGKPAPSDSPQSSPPGRQMSAPATSPTPSAPTEPARPPSFAGISMTGGAAPQQATVFIPPLSHHSGEISAAGATLGDLLGHPGKENWTPVEIVQRVAGLPAVAGAMLSLGEGQVAAAELPPDQVATTIAARIPRLYAGAAEEVRQMELDPLSFLSFSTSGTPWLVFKLGNIFFTVQGRPGEHLPASRLESIAVQIGRKLR